MAIVIVVMRVLFRVLLGGGLNGGEVLLDLPEIPLPDWVLGLHLLGPVTRESVLAGLYDGLRLATIVICVGAANSLANPKRLLRSVPAALHEVGAAMVVAVTVLPQLADSARRVRAAQALRAGDTRRRGLLRRFLVPVLEDALERSLRLAAGMDTRGYGRSGGATRRERRLTGALMLVGLCGVCVGVYAGLDHNAPRVLATPMLAVGRRRGRRRAGDGRPPGRPEHLPPRPVAVAGVRRDAVRRRDRGRRLVGGRPPAAGRLPRPLVVPRGHPGRAASARRSGRWPRPSPPSPGWPSA